MKATIIQSVFGLTLAALGAAYPTNDDLFYHYLNKRALTPDSTCGNVAAGNNLGYVCDPSLPLGGGCCSASGYCGNSTDYCGTGCQAAFGVCSGTETGTPVDPDMCGPANGNNKCTSGLCCSGVGYCGNTTDYCGDGCQSGFGDCGSTVGGGGGTCGPAFGNAQCPTGQCCSAAGYCGTTSAYCADPDCQFQFGTCDSNTTPAGASTLTDPRPLLGSVSYDDDINDCVEDNVVALTYDDGPYLYTNELLDVLKQFGFHATFFITGNNIGKGPIDTTAPYPSVIQRMIAEGHQVASHTWSHYSLSNITSDMRKSQMGKNERAFANIIGKYPTYMRPPYSQCDAPSGCQADMKALGYHRIYFDLDTQDYLNPLATQIQTSKSIVKAALTNTQGQGITDYLSIQHDIVQQSVANLTSYYYGLIKANGWKGVTAGECLGDPQANWYRTPAGSTAPTPVTSSKPITSLTSTIATTPSATTPSATTPSATKPSTTQISTQTSTSVPVPTAAPTCVVQARNFCGTIQTFGDKVGCQKSASNCFVQETSCPKQAGKKNLQSCINYNSVCQKLTQYCNTCDFTCSSSTFGQKTLVRK